MGKIRDCGRTWPPIKKVYKTSQINHFDQHLGDSMLILQHFSENFAIFSKNLYFFIFVKFAENIREIWKILPLSHPRRSDMCLPPSIYLYELIHARKIIQSNQATYRLALI